MYKIQRLLVTSNHLVDQKVTLRITKNHRITLPETNSSPMKIPIEILVNTIKTVDFPWRTVSLQEGMYKIYMLNIVDIGRYIINII